MSTSRRLGAWELLRELRGDRGLRERDPLGRRGGMHVVAIPNRVFPPSEEALALADVVLESLDELTVEGLAAADDELHA